MKTAAEIRQILDRYPAVDVHIHTHLCDGAPDMTVANIAEKARQKGLGAIVLTPHWHKQVSDETETLYADSKMDMLLALREEIEAYDRADGRVQVLLSSEVDILSVDGTLALEASAEIERNADLITPTVNFNPILPLRYVRLTYGKDINGLHESGDYERAAQKAGGVEKVLEAMYDAEVNAVLHSPYPCMLGHFLAAHSIYPDRYNWFGVGPDHLPLIKAGADRVIAACAQKHAMIDLTGIHLVNETVEDKIRKEGFWFDFQRYVVCQCRAHGVGAYPGSDAHSLKKVGQDLEYYDVLFQHHDF